MASSYVIVLKTGGFDLPFPIRTFDARFRMLKVFAPMDVKLEVNPSLITSIAVRIPTRAIIPKAIIMMVKNVRNDCDRMEVMAIRMFSKTKGFILQR